MPGTRQAKQPISSLRALVFATAVSVALIFVLFPILPGEVPLQAGDIAYRTFEVDGEVIVKEGRTVTATHLREIKDAGLLDNHLNGTDVAAAVIFGILGGAALGLYVHLFQPREVNTLPRLIMVPPS